MYHKILLCCCIIIATPTTINSVSVVGPRILRPFGSYRMSIAGGSRAQTLYVAVEGRKANGEQFNQGREVQVQAASSRIVELEIGDPGPGEYALVARSTAGPLFSSSAPLAYQPRSFCVFVQTDKRIYQPGDTIHFRVIALDKYLLPLPGALDVNILDAGGSPVRQWIGLTLDRGLITEEFVLADEPALGEWTIQVEARGQIYSKKILVADYVMPKFQLQMDLPKEVLFSEGRFNINVTAKHFNGLPVEGELTISAYAVFFSGLLQPVVSSPARKVINFSGQTNVVFDLKSDLDLAEDAARPLVVEAVLEEKDTLIRQNISTRILLLRTPYRLKVTAPSYFKPTLPYNVQIEVVDPSGQVMDTDGEVEVERLWDDGAPVNTTKLSLKNGLATYTLVPDRAHVNSTLNLVVKYKEVSERVVNVQRNEYSNGQFLTMELLSKAGEDIRVRLTATEAMDLIHYVVIGRGDILVANTMELNPGRTSVDISVPVSSKMAPGCAVVAWYPRLAGGDAVLAAAVYAPQNNLLQNNVKVSPVGVTGSTVAPDSQIELRVSGEPGSIVAVLGEDMDAVRAGLAGNNGLGSGLDMHTIEREVESFSGLMHSMFKNEDHLPGMGIDLGGYTSYDVFKNAGVLLLTDGMIIKSKEGEPSSAALETGTRPPLAGPYAFSRLPPPPSPRFYLTVAPHNTWMLANFTVENDGKGIKESRTPVGPSELSIGAFAIHPTLGLGIASPEVFTTSVPLSISAELPATLQKGETLAAVVILKSSLSVDTSVEVTFYNSNQNFEFEPLDNNVDSTKKIELFRRERLTVPAKGSASTAFLVTVVRTGEAPVFFEARGNGVSVSLSRTIDVKDGYEEDIWSWSLLDARTKLARTNVSLDARPGVRPGPVMLIATGDLLSGAVQAVKLPPAPAATPSHAVRPLALACVVLDYLQASGQEDIAVKDQARTLAGFGYQRLMAYRRSDGSFAPEIDDEAEGDVWMTSVALRWLGRCGRYVSVSPGAANMAATWLARAQLGDGSWRPAPLPARFNPSAQAQVPLTAHALLALLQYKGSDVLYKDNIIRAQEYLAQKLSPELDAYTLAVTSGALAAARNSQSTLALQMMDKYANTSGSTLFWPRKLTPSEWRNPWLKGNSLDATTASWALRGMLAARLVDESVPVVKYLLQAYKPVDPDPDVVDVLAQFSETIRSSTKLRVSVNVTGSEETRQFQIGQHNSLIIQTQSVRNAKSASAVTEGRGIALVGLSAKGSTNVTAPWPRFTLDPRVDQVSTKHRLQLSICYGFVAQGNETESGLALLTVQLPSGYLADINTLSELTSLRHVVRARTERGGAVVRAWVVAARGERCATLAAPRATPVAAQRPGWATLHDIYDTSHQARQFFQPIPSTACDVCRLWDSCSRACGAAALQRAPESKGGKADSSPDAASNLAVLGLTGLLALATAVILV